MQSYSPLFTDLLPLSANQLMVNSFTVMKDLGCVNLNLTSPKFENAISSLDERIRRKFFDKKSLKEKIFLYGLSKILSKFDRIKSNLSTQIKNITKDDYLDEDVLRLVKFLSKHVVDIECLQSLPMQQIVDAGAPNIFITFYYYDFDFIDTKAYLDYKLFNKLNTNPKLNLLNGITSDESCSVGLIFSTKYFSNQTTPPQASCYC